MCVCVCVWIRYWVDERLIPLPTFTHAPCSHSLHCPENSQYLLFCLFIYETRNLPMCPNQRNYSFWISVIISFTPLRFWISSLRCAHEYHVSAKWMYIYLLSYFNLTISNVSFGYLCWSNILNSSKLYLAQKFTLCCILLALEELDKFHKN